MKLTWKNYAHGAFRIVAILHICLAVNGQTRTPMGNAMSEKATQATSAVQATASARGISNTTTMPPEPTETTATERTRSPIGKATTSSSSMTMTSENNGKQTTKTTSRMSDTASKTEHPTNKAKTSSPMMSSGPATPPPPTNTSKTSSRVMPPIPTPTDNTSTIIIIIVVVAAIIVIFIAIVTAVCLCCCKGNRRDAKGYSSPKHNGKVTDLAKDQPPSGHRSSNDMNGYESVNEKEQVDKSSTSVDKPSSTDPNCYSNEGLTDEDETNKHVNTASDERYPLAEKSKTKTGNLFDDIDPTTTTYSHHVYNEHDHKVSTRMNNKFQEQIELNPSKSPTRVSTPEEERTLEAPKSATGQLTDKERETVTPPKPVVRRNISNRNDNVIKLRPKPQPRSRPVSRALQDDAGTAKDNASPGTKARDPSTGAEPLSPTSHQEKQRMFRPPLKGKGPDGSDQAALLANVLRKSNAPRQIEEDTSVNKEEGTTYW